MFSISLLGDVMLGRLVPLPNKIDEDVINFLQESSLNIANLECVVTDRSEVKSQLINKPKKFMCKHGANQKQGLLLKKLKVGCCNFANNHILDYGFHGVKDTIQFFNETGLKWFGFGKNWETAWKPRILRLASNADSEPTILKVALFGISDHFVEWKADNGAGINYFNINNFQNAEQNLNRAKWQAFDYISEQIDKVRGKVSLIIFSIHWGENFQRSVPVTFQEFAHILVDTGVDVIHGHSSHHVQGIEVYKEKFILYGCGEFINDYDLYEELLQSVHLSFGEDFAKFRSDLSFVYKMYIKKEESSGTVRLTQMKLLPIRIQRGCVSRAIDEGLLEECFGQLFKACERFGTKLEIEGDFLVLKNT